MTDYFNENNIILKLTFEFGLSIIEYTELLESLHKRNMAWQLFDSGTSIGANANEAQNAESRADFIHKMKVSAKEGEETYYWLSLCHYAPSYPECEYLLEKVVVINKILTKIISSSR